MMWILRIFVIGVLTFIVAGVMAMAGEVIWWLAALTAAMLYFGEAFVLRKAFGRLIEAPFRAKGAVLRDAVAKVHKIEPAEPPSRSANEFEADDTDDEDEDDEEDREELPADHTYFTVDVTITPQAEGTKFSHWEPLELAIVPGDAPPANKDDDGEESQAVLHRIEVHDGNEFVEDEGMKYPGAQRLRMLVGVPPALRLAKFRYYFEDFGSLEFPRRR